MNDDTGHRTNRTFIHSFIHAYMYIFNMYMYIANARTLHTTSIGLQIG